MKPKPEYYNLYCLNRPCVNSVFHKNIKTAKRYTAQNLVAQHICPNCHQPLACYMDILIEQAFIAEVKSLSYCR